MLQTSLLKYKINSQGINLIEPKPGLIGLAEENGQLKIFITRQETDLKLIYSTCFPKEMIGFLGINEAKSWETVTSSLNAQIDRLGLILDRQGILHPGMSSTYDLLPADDEPAAINDTDSQIDTVPRMTALTGNWIDQDIYRPAELPQDDSNSLVFPNIHRASVVDQNNVSLLTNRAPRQYVRKVGTMLEEGEIEPSGIALEATTEYHGGKSSFDEINNVTGNFEAQRQAVIEHARSSNTAAFNLVASSTHE